MQQTADAEHLYVNNTLRPHPHLLKLQEERMFRPQCAHDPLP